VTFLSGVCVCTFFVLSSKLAFVQFFNMVFGGKYNVYSASWRLFNPSRYINFRQLFISFSLAVVSLIIILQQKHKGSHFFTVVS